MGSKQRNLEITWPLFGDAQPFPADPERTVTDFEPPAADLAALETAQDSPSEVERIERELEDGADGACLLAPFGDSGAHLLQFVAGGGHRAVLLVKRQMIDTTDR
jgi:hypothetical protein